MREQLLITFTERTPTEDGKDLNTYSLLCNGWEEVNQAIENFWINFGVLVSITIVPTPKDLHP